MSKLVEILSFWVEALVEEVVDRLAILNTDFSKGRDFEEIASELGI